MKARIEKKLCGRLVQMAPVIFKDAWVDKEEPSKLAYEQGSMVSHILSVGGGLDYWGEGQDVYTAWELWRMNWMWYGPFEQCSDGDYGNYPDTRNFKPTTRNLLKLAAEAKP